MKGQLLVPLAFCAVVTAGCGATTGSVRSAASMAETQSVASTTSSTPSTISATRPCTEADLNAPPIKVMPAPKTVKSLMILDDGNETLSPPYKSPSVAAAQGWAKVVGSGFGPRASGPASLLLAELSAKTPATIQNYTWPPTSDHPDTLSTPTYTRTLVWAVIATDQAEVGLGGASPAASGPAATVTRPPCSLGTAITYVDADTGAFLVAENF
jgi:hypothetical protein